MIYNLIIIFAILLISDLQKEVYLEEHNGNTQGQSDVTV